MIFPTVPAQKGSSAQSQMPRQPSKRSHTRGGGRGGVIVRGWAIGSPTTHVFASAGGGATMTPGAGATAPKVLKQFSVQPPTEPHCVIA